MTRHINTSYCLWNVLEIGVATRKPSTGRAMHIEVRMLAANSHEASFRECRNDFINLVELPEGHDGGVLRLTEELSNRHLPSGYVS